MNGAKHHTMINISDNTAWLRVNRMHVHRHANRTRAVMTNSAHLIIASTPVYSLAS